MDAAFKKKLKESTPVIKDLNSFIDADDEMLEIAEYIKTHNQHNSEIDPTRIKFLYSPKPNKDGRFVLHNLIKRSDIEKMVNDQYDFILTMFYDVWVQLEPEQKLICLDKALCGIELDYKTYPEIKTKKKPTDLREYARNMHAFGPDVVLRTAETVDLACQTALEKRKEREKEKAKGKVNEDELENINAPAAEEEELD